MASITSEIDNDDQKSSHKKKKQKKQHPNKNAGSVSNRKNDDSTQGNQLSPTATSNSNMITSPLSLPPQLSPDALRSFVQKYIIEKYGERSVMVLTSRVAQKSYGTEKR